MRGRPGFLISTGSFENIADQTKLFVSFFVSPFLQTHKWKWSKHGRKIRINPSRVWWDNRIKNSPVLQVIFAPMLHQALAHVFGNSHEHTLTHAGVWNQICWRQKASKNWNLFEILKKLVPSFPKQTACHQRRWPGNPSGMPNCWDPQPRPR